jgi:hypothetical protein
MKVKLKSGQIFQIPLLENLGFGYAKFINLDDIVDNPSYPHMIKIFKYKTSDKSVKMETVMQQEYLLQPLVVAGIKPTLRNNEWSVIGSLPLLEEDYQIPDFKVFDLFSQNQFEAKSWFLVY